jgi:hypothetical protein
MYKTITKLAVLKERRVVASLVSGILFFLTTFGIITQAYAVELTELVVPVIMALGNLAISVLTLLSFMFPKKFKK